MQYNSYVRAVKDVSSFDLRKNNVEKRENKKILQYNGRIKLPRINPKVLLRSLNS